ncbi:hypothetical protein J5N97_000923 [Dioscorea zingiberensis]|uniref:K Homology domain-containing protein n=1 Tax=Dioscorea zingiberensis TaxID=325984 RepID=A0A9D5BUT3_9LILI|nr:hypothetical protein J5N97_000923 [Dioscorea zingiberensis]
MERSRSKRSYHYDHDSDPPTPPSRSKPRRHHPYPAAHHHRRERRPTKLPSPPPPPPPPASATAGAAAATAATTVFRILCPEVRAGAVVGKSGSTIKAVRQRTGAWISVHELAPGDAERIIETSDSRRRDADGRPPQFSPAQDALILIHERIVDAELEYGGGEDGDEFSGWERSGRGRMTTRLVVPRSHVGCLLGKGGKIIEQMRMETKTHIRILPRDQYTPQCVSPSEEVVQVVGEGNCVKKAVEIISSRLLESLHRDRGPFSRRLHSPEHYFPQDDEFMNSAQNQSAMEGSDIGSRSSTGA